MPCPPTNVSAVHTCAPHPVPVSWVASDSAKYYTAVAVSGGGHRSECMTNTTSCGLPGLRCGEVYSIGVSGADDNCTGQLSDTVSLNTGNTISFIMVEIIFWKKILNRSAFFYKDFIIALDVLSPLSRALSSLQCLQPPHL